jgi:antitoxin HigA-1
MAKKLRPVHPGEILFEDYLKPLGLSMNQLALDLHVPVTRIAELVHRRRAITPNTALRLARYFDTTPAFWLNLQSKFDLDTAEDSIAEKVRREVRPRSAQSRSLTGSAAGASFRRSMASRTRSR